MFRVLIPALADDYHVVAPDLPGFGFSEAPSRAQFRYTFDHLADVIERFTTVAGLTGYAIYVFDYGAPVGFRLAARPPGRITRGYVIVHLKVALVGVLDRAVNPVTYS